MICPKCSSAEVRHCQRAGWADALQSWFGRRAYRCRSCRWRFHAVEDGEPAPAKSHKRSKRRGMRSGRQRAVQILIFAVMLIMFLIFLRYLTREPSIGGGDTGRLNFPLSTVGQRV